MNINKKVGKNKRFIRFSQKGKKKKRKKEDIGLVLFWLRSNRYRQRSPKNELQPLDSRQSLN